MRAMLAAMLGLSSFDPFARWAGPLRVTRVADLPPYVDTTTWRRRALELERTKRRQSRS